MKRIISYILSFILMCNLIILLCTSISTLTILNKDYILKKLDENNYYEKVYEEVLDGFEQYIYQSGLDKDVLENIVNREIVKNEIDKIINCIYENKEYEIDTEKLKNELNKNIEQYLNSNSIKVSSSQRKLIDNFVTLIEKDYENKFSYLEYLKPINKVIEIVPKVEKFNYYTIGAILLFMVIINVKDIKKIFKYIGVSVLAQSTFVLGSIAVFNFATHIEDLEIFATSISVVIVNTIMNIINNVITISTIGSLIGCLFIFIGSLELQKSQNKRYLQK